MHKCQASQDLRAHIPVLHCEDLSVKEICQQHGIKKLLVYLVLNLYNQFGVVSGLYNYSYMVGHSHSLSQADLAFLSTLLDYCKSLYLNELQNELQLKRGVHTSLPMLYHALQQLGISCKVISVNAYERNELLCGVHELHCQGSSQSRRADVC